MAEQERVSPVNTTLLAPLLAGAIAGVSVDVAMYPLDTLKTRLQSAQGFQKAGGFRGVYRGLLTVATGSMPITALFFVSYETTKKLVQPLVAPQYTPLVNMLAAIIGEGLACVIRVPMEIAKQRKQTGTKKRSSISILIEAYKVEGVRRGLYRGFQPTVARDLPFSFIQLPIWEMLKSAVKDHNDGEITSFHTALCGFLAGGFAAAVTTPLDLAKTRIMLASRQRRLGPVLAAIYWRAGLRGLFAGAAPRVATIGLGAFLFFGFYDDTKGFFEEYFSR